MSKLKNKGILLFLLAFAVLYAILYIVPRMTTFFDATYLAEYGELSSYVDGEACFVRNEKVYRASAGGNVNRLAAEGDLLRAGTQVVAITEGEEPTEDETLAALRTRVDGGTYVDGQITETGGLVSFYADGFESVLTPDTMADLSFDDYSKLTQDQVVSLSATAVAKGSPVFKLIDRTNWYLVSYLPTANLADYAEDERVTVTFDPPADDKKSKASSDEAGIEMRVVSVEKGKDQSRLILRTDRFIEDLGKYRRRRVRITDSTARGLLLEKTSVISKDGLTGVYVRDKKGKYVFTPVHILSSDASNDSRLVVAPVLYYDDQGQAVNTIRPFDDILKNPKGEGLED